MIIPLGTASLRRHFPTVTVALIAANIVVFALTHGIAADQEDRYARAAAKLRKVELKIEADHLTKKQQQNGWIASFFGKRTRTEEDFWERFSLGQVVSLGSDEYEQWHEAKEAELARLHEHVFYRWGFRNTNPNPLCILTSLFLHDGYLHILGNMLFLWVVGANMEDAWGRRYFLLLYTLGGVCATAAQAWAARSDSDLPNIGASGAVASVMGAFLIRHFKTRIRFFSLLVYFGPFTAPAGVVLPIWFLFQLRGVTESDPDGGGVAFMAHVGGFLLGAALALAFHLGRVTGTTESPAERKDERHVATDAHRERAHAARAKGHAQEALLELAEALALDPGDDALRREKIDLHRAAGDEGGLLKEGEELLRRLWRRGEKRALADAFRWLDELAPGRLPSAFALRAAAAIEPEDPHGAAQLFWRAAQASPNDPTALQALKRYAAVLDRLGAGAQADQVRAMIASRERAAATP